MAINDYSRAARSAKQAFKRDSERTIDFIVCKMFRLGNVGNIVYTNFSSGVAGIVKYNLYL